jgi:hypothetical protein
MFIPCIYLGSPLVNHWHNEITESRSCMNPPLSPLWTLSNSLYVGMVEERAQELLGRGPLFQVPCFLNGNTTSTIPCSGMHVHCSTETALQIRVC